jgi:hypothetical protein
MRMVLLSPDTPWLPISMLKLPVVMLTPAPAPMAMLAPPVALCRVNAPMAVLELPAVTAWRAL